MPVASRAVVSDVFEDQSELVKSIARRFAFRHGLDVDDVTGHANLIFLAAFRTYDATLGKLETRLQTFIHNRLIDVYRPHFKWSQRLTISHISTIENADERLPSVFPRVFDPSGLFAAVGDDARVVLGLLLDTPDDLAASMRDDFQPGTMSIRRNLRNYLTNNMGWAIERVRETFGEIRDALGEL